MYTTPIEAFYDLVFGMNRGLSEAEFTFQDCENFDRAKSFHRMTQSITERPIIARKDKNKVEVHIYDGTVIKATKNDAKDVIGGKSCS